MENINMEIKGEISESAKEKLKEEITQILK